MLTLEQELFTRFGYAAFKPGQKEVITNLLDGMNTLAVLFNIAPKEKQMAVMEKVMEDKSLSQAPVNHCVINLWARS